MSGISETLIRKSEPGPPAEQNSESPIRKFGPGEPLGRFPLPWTVHLIRRATSPEARRFYEAEALRGGWSVRQLDRQIASQFYERTGLSKNKAAMLERGSRPRPGDAVSADDEVRDPLVLEFLGLKDEHSENDLEEALVYAREHWIQPGENPPVGLILCSEKNDALAHYALEGLPSKVLAREYRVALPDEKRLAAEIEKTREHLEAGRAAGGRGTSR